MQYSKSKFFLEGFDDKGVFKMPSIEGPVAETAIVNIFSQGINAEKVNQLSGMVSEKTIPLNDGDTF